MKDLDKIFIDLDDLADDLIKQLQGTMALEGQGLPKDVLREMKKKTIIELHEMLGILVQEKVYGRKNKENI